MKRFTVGTMVVCLAAALSGTAMAASIPPAGYTLVNTGVGGVGTFGGGDVNSFDGPGHTLVDVMQSIYGGTASGNIYSSILLTGATGGDVTLTRIKDSGGSGPLNLGGANGLTADDSQWVGNVASVTAVAKVASYNQRFGFKVASGPDATLLANANSPGATAGAFNTGLESFQWWRSGNTTDFTSNKWYSDPATNGGNDHMVTFAVSQNGHALAGTATWLLCWEDLSNFATADRDYQDLVVQVTAGQVVPTPAAAWMGGLTLGTLMLVRMARRHAAAH